MAEATSDAGGPSDVEGGGPPMPVSEILEHEMEAGLRELDRPARGLFLSALSAGLDVGFGPMLIVVVLTLAHDVSPVWRALLAANAYAVGFAFVVLGRSELFTEHTTLAAFPVLDGRAPLGALGRLWGIVYVANVAGALVSGILGALILRALGVASAESIEHVAGDMTGHPWWTIFVSAILAGWLMGLLTWLSRTTRATLGLLAMVWIVTTTIGLAKLHHCIAGTVEVAMALVTPRSTIGGEDFARFLIFSTLGNAIGGSVFVALVKLGHARAPSRRE